MPKKPPRRTKGPLTPGRINPVTGKAQAQKLLPGATIYGLSLDSTEYVAWDGKQYVVCQTKDRVLADDSLLPIGSVQELRVDHSHPRVGRVEVVIPTPQLNEPKAGLVSIRSLAPLSTFEATVGELMVQARSECPTKHLPQSEILKIAALLDDKKLSVRDNLERGAARTMAEYNQRRPMNAIKTWRAALGLAQFRRSVRKRFSRAEEKYKKATALIAQSAGTPRTTI